MSTGILRKLACLLTTGASRSLVLVAAFLLVALPAVAANPASTTITLAITAAGNAVTIVPFGTAVNLTATVQTQTSQLQAFVVVALLCGTLATLSACGGGSSKVLPSNPTTPDGTYNVRINVAGPNNLTQSTTISLVVQ